MKSEPSCFSIEDLAHAPEQTAAWDGVRNYQARNFMRDTMKKGDLVFFYHSSCPVPAIMGTAQVVKEAYPDHTAWTLDSEHPDPKSTPSHPLWYMVDIQLQSIWKEPLSLQTLKQQTALENMRLLQKGNRLSVLPVTPEEWKYIVGIAKT
ncbi:MAG: EVE domain-containing protein [Legionellaceae bacterium]|nr:EVE domain-containing protein [Legionellaceae bacterium]